MSIEKYAIWLQSAAPVENGQLAESTHRNTHVSLTVTHTPREGLSAVQARLLSIGTRTSRQLLSAQQALLPKPHLEAGLRLDVLLTCRDDALRQLALLLATNEASVVDLAPDVVAELVQLGNHRVEAQPLLVLKQIREGRALHPSFECLLRLGGELPA